MPLPTGFRGAPEGRNASFRRSAPRYAVAARMAAPRRSADVQTGRSAVVDSALGRLGDTHWTRMLHYDLMRGDGAGIANDRDPMKKSFEARLRARTPLVHAGILLGIYVAMYVAVGAVVEVWSPLDV